MIEVKDLVKNYNGHLAIDHLSFKVEKGQILGFLGPNGAGKSTTMNIITGYISATEGSVSIDGYDIFKEPEKAKRAIGYLPEIPPLYLDMTVKEYLNFVADIKKVKKNEKDSMIVDIMNRTKIMDVSERLIKHLSKGYKQRVGIAGAMVGDPEVLILDEPTVGLDPMQIIEIRDLIKELSKEHTVILSSHILSEISAVCDKVLIINKGKLIASDTPDHLVNGMTNTNNIKLIVQGELETIEEALKTIPKIMESTVEEVKQENSSNSLEFNVLVKSRESDDIREELFYALANAKCPILAMVTSKKSLEDIFLELTKDDIEEVTIAEEDIEIEEVTIAEEDIETKDIEIKEEVEESESDL